VSAARRYCTIPTCWEVAVGSRRVELVGRVEVICRRGLAERALRVAVLAELRTTVSFDAYAWLLTDPETSVGWSPAALSAAKLVL